MFSESINQSTHNKRKLTVQPFGIVFQCSLEGEFTTPRRVVVQIGAEDDCIRFGELGIGAGIECGQVAGISALHPNGGGIVARVKRTFGDTHAHSGHVLVPSQMRQVGLNINKSTDTHTNVIINSTFSLSSQLQSLFATVT